MCAASDEPSGCLAVADIPVTLSLSDFLGVLDICGTDTPAKIPIYVRIRAENVGGNIGHASVAKRGFLLEVCAPESKDKNV